MNNEASESKENQFKPEYCQNCTQELSGPYCHYCGQKHIEEKESFGKMILHFLGDFIHFDSKVFTTLKPLIFKPGKVPGDYVQGRRARYLDPIRMYVFLSIVFFSLFFFYQTQTANEDPIIKFESSNNSSARKEQIDSIISEVRSNKLLNPAVNNDEDEAANVLAKDGISGKQPDTLAAKSSPNNDKSKALMFGSRKLPETTQDYFNEQASLDKKDRDSWFVKNIILKSIHIKERAIAEEGSFFDSAKQEFLHTIPKIFFILLPLFALILKLLYFRHKLFYIDHFVFTTYFYNVYFILFSMVFLVEIAVNIDLSLIAYPLTAIYFYMAMVQFYKQEKLITMVKFFIFLVLSGFLLLLGIIAASIWTIIKL